MGYGNRSKILIFFFLVFLISMFILPRIPSLAPHINQIAWSGVGVFFIFGGLSFNPWEYSDYMRSTPLYPIFKSGWKPLLNPHVLNIFKLAFLILGLLFILVYGLGINFVQ